MVSRTFGAALAPALVLILALLALSVLTIIVDSIPERLLASRACSRRYG